MVLVAGKMYRPTDVAFDIANDTVYAVEQFNHRISKWNYTAGNFDFTLDASWGSNGDGTSGQGGPIGDGGPTDNSLYRPTGIVFDGTRLVVTDTFHDRIRTLNSTTGAFIGSAGSSGFGDTNFYRPAGIAVDDAQTFLVIADELNHRAVRYSVAATPVFQNVLLDPSGVLTIAVDVAGTGYTVAPVVTITGGNGNGATATAVTDGDTITAVNVTASGRGYTSVPTVTIAPPDTAGTNATATATVGGALSFIRPHGVIFDSNPNFFQVTDSQRGVISRYNITATSFLSQHGAPGTTGFDLFFPSGGKGVISAGTDTAFADTRNNIIKGVDTVTLVNTSNTTPGTGDGQLYYPESVAAFADTASYVLVANTLNNRVEAFSSAGFVLTFQQKFGTP